MSVAIDEIRKRGDSCGGEVTCVVRNCPIGLGSPVFDKLEAELAKAVMSLPATKVPRHFVQHRHSTYVRALWTGVSDARRWLL